MAIVLVVDDASTSAALQDALSEQSLVVAVCASAEAQERIKAERPVAVVVTSLAETAPRFVAQLRAQLQAACPPLIVVLASRSDTVRDQSLIAGATDVSPDGQPEDVAARVDAVVNGWLRGMPRKPLNVPLKAQRGRQPLSFQAAEIDPTGFGLASPTEVPRGELVRVALPLPGGAYPVWGRIAEADDGAPGVRFLALSGEERVRIVSALRSLGDAGPASRPPAATPVSSSAPTISGPPVAQGTPAEPRPAIKVAAPASRPVPVMTPSPVAPQPSVPAPVAATPPEPPANATPPVASPVVAEVPASPPATASGLSLDDLIGSTLADGTAVVPSEPAPEPAAAAAAEAENTGPAWPFVRYAIESSVALLKEGASVGLVGESEGAPSGDIVLKFVRSLSIPEQHIFDAEPPTSLPDPTLAIPCLGLRLRLFAYSLDATQLAAQGPYAHIDAAFISALDAEVNTAASELQKSTNAFLTTADTQRIKEMNQFRNALIRAQNDFRTALAKLKGELPVSGSGSAVRLDEEHHTPEEQRQAQLRREAPKEQPKEKLPEFVKKAPGFEKTPAQRRKQLLIFAAVSWSILSGIAYWAWPRHPRPMAPEELAEIGATSATFFDEKHQAVIIVPDSWRADASHSAKLDTFLAKYRIETYVVQNTKGAALIFGVPSKPKIVTSAATASK